MPQGVSLAGPMDVRWWCRVQKPPNQEHAGEEEGNKNVTKKKEGKKKKPSGHSNPLILLPWLPKRKIPSGRRLRRFTPCDRNIDHVHVSLSCLLSLLYLPTMIWKEREMERKARPHQIRPNNPVWCKSSPPTGCLHLAQPTD